MQAQLRAAVFSAIDEEEKKSDEHTNASNLDRLSNDAAGANQVVTKPLHWSCALLNLCAGSAMLGLVQEFLSFYNFQYSLSVLHSESGQVRASSSFVSPACPTRCCRRATRAAARQTAHL